MPKRKITVREVRDLLREAERAVARQVARSKRAKTQGVKLGAADISNAIAQRMRGLSRAAAVELKSDNVFRGMIHLFSTSADRPLTSILVEREFTLLKKAIKRKR